MQAAPRSVQLDRILLITKYINGSGTACVQIQELSRQLPHMRTRPPATKRAILSGRRKRKSKRMVLEETKTLWPPISVFRWTAALEQLKFKDSSVPLISDEHDVGHSLLI